jgi:hypothetical protein
MNGKLNFALSLKHGTHLELSIYVFSAGNSMCQILSTTDNNGQI